MCGVTGFWGAPGAEPEHFSSRLCPMMESLVHRGPDDEGSWIDPEAGVALGFRRLAILDLSPTGRQPMFSEDGRLVIIFNGEIYNFQDLRCELMRLGDRFRGSSDTEVILACWRRWGAEESLRKLSGMFAIAMWDRREATLTLARDRIGKKPLYYGNAGGVFLFGSELKALRAFEEFRPEIDPESVSLYARYGYVPSPWTIYRGIAKLPPGHFVVVNGRHLDGPPRKYWDVQRVVFSERVEPRSEEEAIEELAGLLSDSVKRRMVADVPLGALLSGGIDSSLVVALMQSQSSRPVKTFTIGFPVVEYNEAHAARQVAEHLGTDHTELYVDPEETQAVIPRLPDLFDEPFADSSQIPTYIVCELARRYVTVSLSGDGGDELFGGYTRYGLAADIWSAIQRHPRWLRVAARGALCAMPAAGLELAYKALRPILPAHPSSSQMADKLQKLAELLLVESPDALYHRLISLWKNPSEVVPGVAERPTAYTDPKLPSLLSDYRERMMYLDLITYLPDDILTKVDRASMAVSLETRCPLLDHRVVESAWRLPLRFKDRRGSAKWILREILHRHVPPELVDRPKTGFGVPVDVWLRGPLRDWAEDLLSEDSLLSTGFFDPQPIRRSWMRHLSGRNNEHYRLWTILMFQAWHRRWAH